MEEERIQVLNNMEELEQKIKELDNQMEECAREVNGRRAALVGHGREILILITSLCLYFFPLCCGGLGLGLFVDRSYICVQPVVMEFQSFFLYSGTVPFFPLC